MWPVSAAGGPLTVPEAVIPTSISLFMVFLPLFYLRMHFLWPCQVLPVLVSWGCCNNHRISGLKQHKLILVQFWKTEIWHQCHCAESRCQQAHAPHAGSGVESFPGGCRPSLNCGQSLWSLPLWSCRLLSVLNLLLPLFYKDSREWILSHPDNPG